MSKSLSSKYIIIIIILITGIFGIRIWSLFFFTPELGDKKKSSGGKLEKITIATISPSFASFTVYVALEKGYFRDQGLDVGLPVYPHGKAALNAVTKGKADMATTSETPFMHAVLNGDPICLFANMITAKKHLAIVARKDSGISNINDLKEKTIGVTLGTNGEYFMDMVLLLNGIPRDQVRILNLKPEQMSDALINGETDAIATWNPQMSGARKAMGDQGITFYADGLYSPFFIMSARKDYVRKHPNVIERVLLGLINGTRFILNHPEEANKIVARYLVIEPEISDELKAAYFFKITLDQPLVLTLEDQTRWAIQHQLTHHTTVPNYLDYIYIDALKSLEPESVTIIK